MSGLGLVPNKVIGYRVIPDTHSWNLALVKEHGENSKLAGQEYVTVLGYYKNLDHVLKAVLDKSLKENLMADPRVAAGIAHQEVMLEAQQKALETVSKVAADLEAMIKGNHEAFCRYMAKTNGHVADIEDGTEAQDNA